MFKWVNGLTQRTSWANGPMRFNANSGIVLFAALLLIGYVISWSDSDIDGVAGSVWAGLAALVALAIGQVIGNLVDRARPYESLNNVHVLVTRTTDFSFPSDHATVAGAVAVGLILVNRWLGIAASVAALLMGFTRVYVGAHYPGDVLAGLVLGGVVAALGYLTIVPLLTRLGERIEASRVGKIVARRPRDRSIAQ